MLGVPGAIRVVDSSITEGSVAVNRDNLGGGGEISRHPNASSLWYRIKSNFTIPLPLPGCSGSMPFYLPTLLKPPTFVTLFEIVHVMTPSPITPESNHVSLIVP